MSTTTTNTPIDDADGTTGKPDGSAVAAAVPPKPRHPLRRWLLLALVVAVVGVGVVAGTPLLLYLHRSHPGAKSVSSAVEKFRASTTTAGDGTTALVGPTSGVYQAIGQGTEKITFPPNSQSDGRIMPITVTTLPGGCWRWHLDYDTAHWHEYDFCQDRGSLLLVAQRNYQRWDFGAITVTNLGTYTCSPPAPVMTTGARPGQRYEHHCTGTNSATPGTSEVDGPVTIGATVTLRIGGQPVRALRQTRVEQLTGSQTGTVTEQWWFDVQTGLPLRAERSYRVVSPSPVGHITYTENGWWQLRSLQPTT